MLKDILKNNDTANFKTLKPVAFNTEVDMYEYNMEGVVEVIARKHGDIIHHDVDHNHVTFFAQQAQINLMREAVYSYYGKEYSSSGGDTLNDTEIASGNWNSTSGLMIQEPTHISKRSTDTNIQSLSFNGDGTMLSGQPFFHANGSEYPKSNFRDQAAANNIWTGSGAYGHKFPVFPTKILLGTGVEFTRWYVSDEAVPLDTAVEGDQDYTPANVASVADTILKRGSVEFAYANFITDGDPLSYQESVNVGGGAYGVGYKDQTFTDDDFNTNIDIKCNWYSATWDPNVVAGPGETLNTTYGFTDQAAISSGIDGKLIPTRTVNHLVSGKIAESLGDGIASTPWVEGLTSYPTTGAYTLKSSDPHNYSYAVRGAIKTVVVENPGADVANPADQHLHENGYSVEGLYYAIPKKQYLGIGRPCFIYLDNSVTEVKQGDDSSEASAWLSKGSANDFMETQITFKAVLPAQAETEYYPYNTFVLKEAGLFSDAKPFYGAYSFDDPANQPLIDSAGSYTDDQITAVEYARKMPAGIMWAKRKIAPVYKEANIEIEINWTLKFQ